MKFKLEIDLSSDAMSTYPEIEKAISRSLQLYHDAISLGGLPVDEDEGTIRDVDGNPVGEWSVTETPIDDEDEDYAGTAAACDEFVPTVALSAFCDACGEPYSDHSTAAKGSH